MYRQYQLFLCQRRLVNGEIESINFVATAILENGELRYTNVLAGVRDMTANYFMFGDFADAVFEDLSKE